MEKRSLTQLFKFSETEKKKYFRDCLRFFLLLAVLMLVGLYIAHGFNTELWPRKFLVYLLVFPFLMAFFNKIGNQG